MHRSFEDMTKDSTDDDLFDAQDAQDERIVEQELGRKERHERQIARAIKQGIRQFRLGVNGPVVWVEAYSIREKYAVVERKIMRRKGSKGQRLKRPREEHAQAQVPFYKLASAVER